MRRSKGEAANLLNGLDDGLLLVLDLSLLLLHCGAVKASTLLLGTRRDVKRHTHTSTRARARTHKEKVPATPLQTACILWSGTAQRPLCQ